MITVSKSALGAFLVGCVVFLAAYLIIRPEGFLDVFWVCLVTVVVVVVVRALPLLKRS